MTYEVVVDNARMLANCFEEAPLESFTLDLPGWHAHDTGGAGDYDILSNPDTGTEFVIPPTQNVGVGYFAETDQGPIVSLNWIYMPDTPDGYVLTRATYVVIAYQEETIGGPNVSPLSNYYPSTGITSAFLDAESSGTIDNYAIYPLPVGAYAGEIEWSGSENPDRLTGPPGTQLPCTRIWNQWSTVAGYSPTNDVHIAYYAIRLYYDPA